MIVIVIYYELFYFILFFIFMELNILLLGTYYDCLFMAKRTYISKSIHLKKKKLCVKIILEFKYRMKLISIIKYIYIYIYKNNDV